VLLVVCQALVAVFCVELCKYLRWVEYPPFNLKTARLWAPVNVLFCLMLFSGFASLQHNSVPMVTIYKNITNIVVTAGDYYFFGSTTEVLVLLAFGIMLGGAFAAAWNDFSTSVLGIFWMTTNCLVTAGYVLYMKFATKTVKLSKFGMVFYNNVLCCLFLLPAAIFRGEVTLFLRTTGLHTLDYLGKNSFAGLVGFFLNFASLNCVSATGPTTYAVIGSLNKVPLTILGYLLFDNIITTETWFFIAISMCGGFLYSYAKIQTARRRKVLSMTSHR
jgi:GDP-mannose transporter